MNVALVQALRSVGLSAVGLNGVSAHIIQCVRRPAKVVSGGGPDPVDFGHVGDVTGINRTFLELLGSHNHVPVLACLGSDDSGRPFNINADTVANAVAVALKADRLLLVTSTPGVLRDVQDPGSRITTLTIAEGHAAIADGTVQGGMIPKLEESFGALTQGVGQIHILGHLGDGDIARALSNPGCVGTALLP
jgi:acetylglutamate kinase